MLIGKEPVFKTGTVQPSAAERAKVTRKLRALARVLGVEKWKLEGIMEETTLWGSDTQEDFGRLRSVKAQVGMLYDEAVGRLGAEAGYRLAEVAVCRARLSYRYVEAKEGTGDVKTGEPQ